MVYKIVFQIPYDEDSWDDDWASDLKVEMPGNPHGPHIKISPNQKDHESGERCTFIRCKHDNLTELKRFVDKVFLKLPEMIN